MNEKREENVKETVPQLIEKSKNIAVMPAKIKERDAFLAGVGLYYMLKTTDKTVSFIYQNSIPDGFNNIMDDKDVTRNMKFRELEVSIDYSNTPASKVHYSTENDVLYLTISPINPDFNVNKIKSRIKGYDYDLIFVIGAHSLDDLGEAKNDLSGELSKAKIINVGNNEKNQRFGYLDVVDSTEGSLSLLVLNKSIEWGLKNNQRSAEALLKGITLKD